MTPRQPLLMTPWSFRALLADDLAPGNTSYVQVATALQAGAVFHVASGTVDGSFLATGPSTFTASGAQTFSLAASSGVHVLGGTVQLDGAGLVAGGVVQASTLTATTGLFLPPGPAPVLSGSARWSANLLRVGTGAATKTMADTDSAQTLTNKTLASGSNTMIDATHLRGSALSGAAPANGQVLKWSATASNWFPDYGYTVTSVSPPFTPSSTRGLANGTIYLAPLTIPGTLTLNQLRFQITGAAGGVTGDVGVYDASGNLVADAGNGAVSFGAAGVTVANVSGAPVTLLAGQYYIAITCNGAPTIRTYNTPASGLIKGIGTLTGGGTVLPNPITPSAIIDNTTMPYITLNQ